MNPTASFSTTPLPSGRTQPQNAAIHPVLTPELEAAVIQKVKTVRALIEGAVGEFGGGGNVAFANSFGAEDMVLTDLICKNHWPIDIFSLDTGRLPEATYALMSEVEKHYNIKLNVYTPDHQALETYVHTYGINAFYDDVSLRKACCAIRKVVPLKRALTGKKAWITGLRAAQSVTRADLPEREADASHHLVKFNPLATWSETEVWAYLRQHKVPTNALHEAFYPSIGCAPCTRAVAVGEDIRAGRWWWEDPETKECGLHVK